MAKKKRQGSSKTSSQPGGKATAEGKTLRSYQVGALPIINRILRRMRLRDILGRCLPPRRGWRLGWWWKRFLAQ